jgi:D-glycero-alpha-D-manno-heptose-7-phosphate kinase
MRISYIGGGTDYLDYFKDSPGGVIAAAINQYVYVYSNPLSEVAEENFRFTYRESESVIHTSHFRHPVVREMMGHLNWTKRSNMGTFADLPSGIGLGGSSAFSVAMAKLLEKENLASTAEDLARLAIYVERELLREPGGFQDQYVAAYGGLRAYDFNGVNNTIVSKMLLSEAEKTHLEDRQLLVWLGQTRNSSSHSLTTIQSIKSKRILLQETYEIYRETRDSLLNSLGNPEESFRSLAAAVQHGWTLKQSFTDVADPRINSVLKIASEVGINSFKLCGAGGVGFLLIMAEPDQLLSLKNKLTGDKVIKPRIDLEGCRVIV